MWLFYLGTVVASVYLFLFLALLNQGKVIGKTVTVDFPLFFFAGCFAYLILPLLEVCISGSNDIATEYSFLEDVILSLSFIFIGALMGKLLIQATVMKRVSNEIKNYDGNEKLIKKGLFPITIIVIGLSLLYIFLIYGNPIRFFTLRYGFYNSGNMNSVSVLLPFSAVGYMLVLNNKKIVYKFRKTIFFISCILIGVFMLGGIRNLGAMMGIALVFSMFYKKNINLLKFLPYAIILFVVVGVIAVGREYGMINFLAGKVNLDRNAVLKYIISVKPGEFGTTRRFSDFYVKGEYSFKHIPGYSYFISPLINLIPSSLWKGRPDTLATLYSIDYWTKRGIPVTEGLGFSPIVEAKMNFGIIWPMVFFFIGLLIMVINNKTKDSENHFYIAGAASAVVLNFFRIDFALTFKFFVIVYVWAKLVQYFMKKMNKEKIKLQIFNRRIVW